MHQIEISVNSLERSIFLVFKNSLLVSVGSVWREICIIKDGLFFKFYLFLLSVLRNPIFTFALGLL